MMLDIAVPA